MKKRVHFFLLSLFIMIRSIYGQELILPDEEAPSSIFSYEIGDEAVDLYISGFWQSSLSGGLGGSWNSDGDGLSRSQFSGFTDGFLFEQSEDLLISLWLDDRFYFETSIIDNYELNTILFGYNSDDESSFLREIKIGNTDIGLGQYSFLNIPEASSDSLGLTALFKGPLSEHQLTARFDPAEKGIKKFKGSFEISDTRLEITDYIQGQFFILPDSGINDLKVYIQDGTIYRLADSDDMVVSEEEGYVFFREPVDRKIAVHYTKNGLDVGDDSLGTDALAADSDGLGNSTGELDITATEQFKFSMGTYLGIDMSSLSETIDSETSLIIYSPGEFSPFELLSVYSLPFSYPENTTPFDIFITDKNLESTETVNSKNGYFDNTVVFFRDTDSLRDPENRYPFALTVDSGSVIYGPGKEISGTPPDKDITIRTYNPVNGYSLGDNVLERSVELSVNGIRTTDFTFDPVTGIAEPGFTPGEDDILTFYYRTKASVNRGGDLMLGLGNKFSLNDYLTAEIGAGLRWNISKGRYTENINDAPGSILFSAGMKYSKDDIELRIDGGLSFYNPDTTGIFRLAGMDNNSMRVSVTEEMLFPAAPPASGPVAISSDRGKLLYKDYNYYNALGDSVLMGYDWAVPADQVYDYSDGGRTGPYAAGSNGEVEGNTAVFEYELEPGQWTGGRIPLTFGEKGLDLSNTESITLKFKLLGAVDSTNTDFYIRCGYLEEDLDKDGILDEETADFEPGFSFNPVNPETGTGSLGMKVGASPDGNFGNGKIDSEDMNGNGILDGENSSLVVSFTAGVTSGFTKPDSSWQTVTINFSPDERKKLRYTTAFEIIIDYTGSGTARGRLLAGEIAFNGSSFLVTPDTGQNVTVSEINESLTGEPGTLLTEDFPDTALLFVNSDSAQNTAKIYWDNAGTWKAVMYTNPVNLYSYGRIGFYMKFLQFPDSITLSLMNPENEGISFSFTPSGDTGRWHRFVFDKNTGILTMDGSSVICQYLTKNTAAENVSKLTVEADTSASGTLYLDEVYLEDPVYGISGGAESSFSYTRGGTVLSLGGKPVLSNLTFTNRSGFRGENFASGFTSAGRYPVYTSTSARISLFNLRLEGNLEIQKEDKNLFLSPGYSILLPLKGVSLKDEYSEQNNRGTRSVYRSIGADISAENIAFSVSAGNKYKDDTLYQNWGTVFAGSFDPYFIDASLFLGLNNKTDPYGSGSSWDSIIESYRLMYPERGTYPGRDTVISLNQRINGDKRAFIVKEEFSASAEGTTERDLSHSQKITLSTPFDFQTWTIEPSYSRLLTVKTPLNKDIFFYSDAAEAAANILSQDYYFKAVPFIELFSTDSGTITDKNGGFEESVYNPEASVSIYRQNSGTLKDLIVPSSAQISAGRVIKRGWDTVSDKRNISASFSSSAFNIFGKMGSIPFFKWYQTEEISGKTGIKASFPSGTEPDIELSWNGYVNFIVEKRKSLSVESDVSIKTEPVSGEGTVISSYNRMTDAERKLKIPVLDPKGEENLQLMNKDSIIFKYSFTDENKGEFFSVSLRHSSSVGIGDRGTLSFTAGAGLSGEKIQKDSGRFSSYTAGFEGGITAKLNF